jgi:hypothetical protein
MMVYFIDLGRNRSIDDTDVVLWYAFGHAHIPRPEDYPLPATYIGFLLKPNGFLIGIPHRCSSLNSERSRQQQGNLRSLLTCRETNIGLVCTWQQASDSPHLGRSQYSLLASRCCYLWLAKNFANSDRSNSQPHIPNLATAP